MMVNVDVRKRKGVGQMLTPADRGRKGQGGRGRKMGLFANVLYVRPLAAVGS